jgi:inner membrane protein
VQSLIGERRGLEGQAQASCRALGCCAGYRRPCPDGAGAGDTKRKGWISSENGASCCRNLVDQGALATEIAAAASCNPGYTASLTSAASFAKAIGALASQSREPQWAQAVLRVPVSDVRGIRRLSALTIDGSEANFGPAGGVCAAFRQPGRLAIDAIGRRSP